MSLLRRRRSSLADEDPGRTERAAMLAVQMRAMAAELTGLANELAEAHGVDRRELGKVRHPATPGGEDGAR